MIYMIKKFQSEDLTTESVFKFEEVPITDAVKLINPARKESYVSSKRKREYFRVSFQDTHLLNPTTNRPHAPEPNDTLIDYGDLRWGIIEVLEYKRAEKSYTLLVYKMNLEKIWEKTFNRPGREAV